MTAQTTPENAGVLRALRLLHCFELRYGDTTVPVAMSSQRLLAYLALRARPVGRTRVIGELWADAPEGRGSACLRSAIWRTPAPEGRPLILATGPALSLAPEVSVDFPRASAWASTVLTGRSAQRPDAERYPDQVRHSDQARHPDQIRHRDQADEAEPSGSPWWNQPRPALHGDLLPDWDEEWILLDRERFRQLRLHALEAQCERLSSAGRYGEALEAGLAALDAEPLRDSARRAVVRVHVREGNVVEALRAYRAYERLLESELGLRPSSAMRRLISELTGGPEVPGLRRETVATAGPSRLIAAIDGGRQPL